MKAFLLFLTCLSLALPALASSDPFADFRIPDHTWQSGTLDFGLSGQRAHSSAGSDRYSSLATNVRGRLSRGWDSDALRYSIATALSGDLRATHERSGSDDPVYFYVGRHDRVDRQAGETWSVDAALRTYPWSAPLGLDISALAQGDYSQGWMRVDDLNLDPIGARREEFRSSVASHQYQTVAGLAPSIGWGRVRDASVVYDVHILEQRLLETGALTRPLSASAREKLAALYYVAPLYSNAHDRPDRFVWRDLERILREDGALAERGLDPYSVLRAREPYAPKSRYLRQRGYFVGAVSTIQSSHRIYRSEQEAARRSYLDGVLVDANAANTSWRYVTSYDQVLAGGQAEYHLPLGWRWQLDGGARVTGPVRPGERGLDASFNVQAAWFVADRWAADASVAYGREYFRPRHVAARVRDFWGVRYGAGIAYYLEDHTSVSVSISEQQTRYLTAQFPPGRFSRQGRVELGISHRFLGRLDAHGVMEPVRPLP